MDESYDIYCFGSGDCGQLGLGEDVSSIKYPTIIPFFKNKKIISIRAGGLHNLALSDDGTVYSWGCNDEKALGHFEPEWTIGKVIFPTPEKITRIACGDSMSAAATENGKVYAWGTFRSASGILGFDNKTMFAKSPILMSGVEKYKIIELAAGSNHIVALSDKGNVFSWGCGNCGQLGRRVLTRHERTGLIPRCIISRRRAKADDFVCSIACGAYHTFLLRKNGSFCAFGLNNYGQLGCGDTNSKYILENVNIGEKFVHLDAGEHHSIGLTEGGHVYCWGRGGFGTAFSVFKR